MNPLEHTRDSAPTQPSVTESVDVAAGSESNSNQVAHEVLTILRRDLRRRWSIDRWSSALGGVMLVSWLTFSLFQRHTGAPPRLGGYLIGEVWLIIGGTAIIRRLVLNRQVADKVAELNETSLIPPMLDVLSQKGNTAYDVDSQRAAVKFLERNLPQVKASDSSEFAERHCIVLRNIAGRAGVRSTSFDILRLVIPALHAIAQIGDTGALSAVRKLHGETTSDQIRADAADCINALELVEEGQANTLLRASRSTDSEDLLRSAAEIPADASLLLQSAEQPTESSG